MLTSTSAYGRTTQFAYDINGNQVASWYFGGTGAEQVQVLNRTEFDQLNRSVGTVQAVLPVGHFITTNLATATIPAQYVVSQTSMLYNLIGQVTSSTDRNGLETQNTYDLRGQLIQTRRESVDENGTTIWLISLTAYDDAGRTIASMSQYVEGTSEPVFGSLNTYDVAGRVTLSEQVIGLVINVTGTANNEEAVVTASGTVISSSGTTYLGQKYRRLKKKTLHANVLTRFGNITLTRVTYRQGSRGRTIAALEEILGIECGATPGAQDLVGRQVAAAGSSQGRCIDVIAERTGARIGLEKLRNLSSHLAEIMEPQRETCQVQQLKKWIDEARKHGKNVTLAVSRDGVSLGIAPFGNFEMASVATLSVYDDGQRIGTIYLACAPEENQATLSRNFTSLLKSIIRSRGSKLSRIDYVSDAGKIETAYWKNVLRHLHVDGQRIKIKRIVDYYHASLRLTTIADALLLTSSQRTEWPKRVRKLLLEPGGWGRVMRSIAGMEQQHGIDPANKEELKPAKRYLHRYRNFMNYSEYRGHGSPIGSGIVESGCKQIVTERLKLSGMRWKHAGARQIMTLPSILLSQTWDARLKNALIALPAVNVLGSQQAP